MNSVIVLLPVCTILIIAVITKRALFAMLCGFTIGSALLAGGIIKLPSQMIDYLYNSMSNPDNQWLILVVALFGIFISIMEKSNAVTEFCAWASKIIKTKRQAMVGTFLLGVIVFIDDYLNNLAVGSTMKAITDKHGIPRTQLAYIVNSTAAPICVLIPISSWAVFFAELFENDGVLVNGTGMGAYLSAIPFIFYGWFAVLVVLLQILGVLPKMGLLKKSYKRAEETGNLFPEGTEGESFAPDASSPDKPHWWNFILPLVVMIVVTLLTDIDILKGVAAAVIFAFLLILVQRKLRFKECLTAAYDGILSMGFVLILFVLAFGIQAINTDLGLADYVIAAVKPLIHGGFLPAVVFLVCAVYAYTTGCFWDMAIIITPIVLPLAQAMGVSPILAGAAVFSGAAFGSNTCLYGDGVILAAQASGIRAIDLMITTLPYASIAGGASVICYLIAGFVM